MYTHHSRQVIVMLMALLLTACSQMHRRLDDAAYFRGRLPYPVEWAAPGRITEAPGDAFTAPFLPKQTSAVPGAPVISEWNRTVHPDESFTMSGIRFTLREGELAGTDTTVWVWAATPDGGRLHQALVWSVRDSVLTATLPDDLPFGMYLVAVENETGVSAPIALNRTTPEWLGPLGNRARAGEAKRVFGRNLASEHGTENSNVFIRPVGSEVIHRCETTLVEPYSVGFIIPANLEDGEYEVYVHNGHGGDYGWGGPLALTIHSQQRSDTEIVVSPDAANLAQAIQAAIDELHGEPDGGTVRLAAGEFNMEEEILLRENVRLAGAGKRETIFNGPTLLIQSSTAVEDLTLTNGVKSYDSAPLVLRDVRFANIDTKQKIWRGMAHERIEIADSDVPVIDVRGDDNWFHGNYIIGYRFYDHAGLYPFGSRVVTERNHLENDWPLDEDGNVLMESSPLMAREDWRGRRSTGPVLESKWIARVVCVAGRGYKPYMDHHYIAHNTSKNVTSEENIGEMILFHDHRGRWFSQVVKNEGTTLTVRTDGLINGEKVTIENIESGGAVQGGVRDYVVVLEGTGLGQARRILSLTEDTITVDSPWRVEPASDSVVVVTPLWVNNIVYKNELNAFIEGYKLSVGTASTGVNIWGNTWNTVCEGNVAQRTAGARNIRGTHLCPSFWNEYRDEVTYDRYYHSAFALHGSMTVGNAFRGGVATMNEHPHPRQGQNRPLIRVSELGIGNIIENATLSESNLGISHGQGTQALLRNNVINLMSERESVGASIDANSDAMLSGNTYVNAHTPYADTGFFHKPIPLHRVAHFRGRRGEELSPVIIPVANAGIRPMYWQIIAEDGWIEAAILDDGSVAPESIGHIEVRIAETARLSRGLHTGRIRIVTPEKQVVISVRLHLD